MAVRTMARAAHNSAFRRAADRALSRHAGGGAWRRSKHAFRLWPRPGRFLRLSERQQPLHRQSATPTICAAIWATCRARHAGRRRWRGGFRRCGSSIAFSMPKATAPTIRPPCCEGPKRARTLPKTLTLAEVDQLLRTAATCDPAAPLPMRLRAARLACLVELLYATGLRVSELVSLPASAARKRCARHHRARQGQQGTHGAAQRRGQASDGGLSGAASKKAAMRRSRNGCSPRSAKAAT